MCNLQERYFEGRICVIYSLLMFRDYCDVQAKIRVGVWEGCLGKGSLELSG